MLLISSRTQDLWRLFRRAQENVFEPRAVAEFGELMTHFVERAISYFAPAFQDEQVGADFFDQVQQV